MDINKLIFWDYFLLNKNIFKLFKLTDFIKYKFVKVRFNNIPLMIWRLDGTDGEFNYIDKIFFVNEPIINIAALRNSESVNSFKYIYESKEHDKSKLIKYGFIQSDSNIEMKLNLNDKLYKNNNNKAEFVTFVKGKHDKLRCDIQNEVFFDNKRTPITVGDIIYEYNRSFFINDLSIFIKVDDQIVGYGQVLKFQNKYTVANIGILKNYQGKGFGRELLIHLLTLAQKKELKELYIRVKGSNERALNLYSSLGFKELEKTDVYEINQ